MKEGSWSQSEGSMKAKENVVVGLPVEIAMVILLVVVVTLVDVEFNVPTLLKLVELVVMLNNYCRCSVGNSANE